ncbi:MAG: hypothetical protein M3077_12805 [Candidatus Dormibacteraeota bacterium]|nr:hypothetical protein [Candidatus Dormibacteraeota bacterium]
MLPTMHLEMWVSRRKDRTRARRLLHKSYALARRITREGGGNGPWLFLIDPDPKKTKTIRLRASMGLRADEDLWLELVFYPNRARMRGIIGKIWKEPEFARHAAAGDLLVSRRRPGFHATLAYATLTSV